MKLVKVDVQPLAPGVGDWPAGHQMGSLVVAMALAAFCVAKGTVDPAESRTVTVVLLGSCAVDAEDEDVVAVAVLEGCCVIAVVAVGDTAVLDSVGAEVGSVATAVESGAAVEVLTTDSVAGGSVAAGIGVVVPTGASVAGGLVVTELVSDAGVVLTGDSVAGGFVATTLASDVCVVLTGACVAGGSVAVPPSAYAVVVPTTLNITTDVAVSNKKKKRNFLDMTLLHSISG